ncbi:MAG: DUF6356 family protein [bacterium]|nr:DUF6356 family protein [bacterium]
MDGYSTPHTRDTANPQTYYEHWRFACFCSFKMIWYGLVGVVHAFLPEIRCLQFATSSFIVRAFGQLVRSGRHDGEIEKVLGAAWHDLARKQREGEH